MHIITITITRTQNRKALDPFLAAANALGEKGAELGRVVEEAWRAQRDFVLMAAAVSDSDWAGWGGLIGVRAFVYVYNQLAPHT